MIRIITIFTFLLFSSDAFALVEPVPLGSDHRIRVISYSPNEVFKFIGHYGYQSSIEFEQDEEILTISMGDSLSWLINPVVNRMFIKPIQPNAITNMTVITTKRTYLFELHALDADSIRDEDLLFVLRFVYPGSSNVLRFSDIQSDFPDLQKQEMGVFNLDYSVRGSEKITPLKIFDDGQFTYFQFRDKNGEIPAFFEVDDFGNESIVNYRTRGDYIVVERVAQVFTLRYGNELVCVYNEAYFEGFKTTVPEKTDNEQNSSELPVIDTKSNFTKTKTQDRVLKR